MSNSAIEKKSSASPINKGSGQYALSFGVISVLLYAAGFPLFLLFFVGILTFFVWKVFTSESRNETRRVFEFYLTANEILRDDDRRWYGFEIQEAAHRGETIIRSMNACPPLVYFALGALYHQMGDHASAVRNLEHVAGESTSDESAIVYPTRELRGYVEMLRKIERAPAEAPLTYSAIRSLERARRNKAKSMLEYSRSQVVETEAAQPLPPAQQELLSIVDMPGYREEAEIENEPVENESDAPSNGKDPVTYAGNRGGRKTISEVLHDIYEENIQ